MADLRRLPATRVPGSRQESGQDIGTVVEEVYVSEQGIPIKWKLVKCNPANVGFETEVEKVLPNWRFTPATLDRQPVGVWIAVPFRFKLDRQPGDHKKPEVHELPDTTRHKEINAPLH